MRERARSVYECERNEVCESVRNRGREYVCVCVRERERGGERQIETE